ncbi:MAG: SurA N-terminal domain-containing protein [Deltaproteobacteria bacterium]|nr:SurA N-terminal domain-containing protein [Deltaproteobacteria bacterium]
MTRGTGSAQWRIFAAILSVAEMACGAAASPRGPLPPEEPPPADDPAVAVRLGCDVVTWAEVDAEAARATTQAGEAAEPDERRAEAERVLVRRALVQREAERLGLAVSAAEVDRVLAGVMERNGWDARALAQRLEERGQTMDEYRAELERDLLEFKVLSIVVRVDVSEEEVRAEYDRLVAQIEPQEARAYEDVRDDIRGRLLTERMESEKEAYFLRLRDTLEALEVRTEGGACVEVWPQYPLSALSFEGNVALGDEALRAFAAGALDAGRTTWSEPDLPGMITRLRAAYMDLGYVEVAVTPEWASDGAVLLRVAEGEAFHIREVRVVVRAEDGTESEPAGGDVLWRSVVGITAGDLFRRNEVGEAMTALGERFADVWGVESVTVEPELEQQEGDTVDVLFVVRPP